MSKELFANNATALLAASINDTDLTIQVANGYGTLYPNPGAGEHFYVTLVNSNGDREIVKITSRSTDLLTVPTGGRGQDGTTAQSWTGGLTRVDARLVRTTMEQFIQRQGDTMEGDLDMDDNELQNADIQDSTFTGGQIVNTPLRGNLDDTSNEVVVPDDGTRATAGGATILCDGDDVAALAIPNGMITMWYGIAADLPNGWAICNGNNGTPDLRGLFVRGATANADIGVAGGAVSASTDSQGAHTHAVTSGPHTLTEAEIPAHTHTVGMHVFVDEADNGTPIRYMVETGTTNTGSTGGGEAHSHPDGTADSQGAHTHSVATVPPFKYLYYVMKVPLSI